MCQAASISHELFRSYHADRDSAGKTDRQTDNMTKDKQIMGRPKKPQQTAKSVIIISNVIS